MAINPSAARGVWRAVRVTAKQQITSFLVLIGGLLLLSRSEKLLWESIERYLGVG
jgi:hypothetical protein